MSTPMRDVRRLPFSRQSVDSSAQPTSRRLSLRNSRLAPSPYTPFSGRRSGTLPPGTPQIERDTFTSNPRSSDPTLTHLDAGQYSADEFVRNRLDSGLRETTVSILSALSRTGAQDPDPEKTLLKSTLDELLKQIQVAEAYLRQRSAHSYVRKHLENALAALRVEAATWQLVSAMWRSSDYRERNLASIRLAPDPLDQIKIKQASGIDKVHRITEWLESLAAEELDRTGGPRVKPLEDPAYCCAYTAQAQGAHAISIDYSLRQGHLDETETKADERLCRELFKLLRAGRLGDAERICRDVGQPWRAAILGGGKNCSALSANGVKGGARKVWLAVVAQTARQSSTLPPHERALYGLLSGIKEPALVVAPDYESRAWVHLTTALDNACEKAISGSDGGIGISDNEIIQIFAECEGASDGHPSIAGDVYVAIRKVRAHLALGANMGKNHYLSLLEALSELGCEGFKRKQEWVVRLASNLSLFIKLTGKIYSFAEDEVVMNNFDSAMSGYARLVIMLEQKEELKAREDGTIREANGIVYELAAWELCELKNEARIVKEYAELMVNSLVMDLRHERSERLRVGVRSREVCERRTLCLEKAGMCFKKDTLSALVLFVVDRVWDSEMVGALDVKDEVTERDELVIRALEFLMFPSFPNSEEAVVRATVAARRFFLEQKYAACKQLVTWFPIEAATEDEKESGRLARRELDAWRMYMDAKRFYQDWQDYFFTNKPNPLPMDVIAAATAESGTCSYEVQASATVQVDKHNEEVEEFNRTSQELRRVAVEAITNTLEYDGGWMMAMVSDDTRMESDENEQRRISETVEVRKQAVPELVWLLHRILHESGEYASAMRVAELVAQESTKLYECFEQSEIKVLLHRVAESAILCSDEMVKSGTVQLASEPQPMPLQRPYVGTFFEEITN